MATKETMKSLSRKFTLRHVLKVVAESSKFTAEEVMNIYLNYKFLGKSNEGSMESYKALVGEKEIVVKRASTGKITINGKFGYHPVEEFDNLMIAVLK